MQTQSTHKSALYPSVYRTHTKSLSMLKNKDFDEFPSFEEAFNQASLKKFFHDHDFISPQNACNSYHECSTAEAQSSTTDVNEMPLSPLTHDAPKFKDSMIFENPTSESHYNFLAMSVKSVNKSDKNLEEKESRQEEYGMESQPMSPRSTFTVGVNAEGSESVEDVQNVISRFISTLTDNIKETEGPNDGKMKEERMLEEDFNMEQKEAETTFERLLKAKKIFRIVRESKEGKDVKENKEVKEKIERKASLNEKRPAVQDIAPEEPLRVQKVRRLSFKILKDTSNIIKKEVEVETKDKKENKENKENEGKKETKKEKKQREKEEKVKEKKKNKEEKVKSEPKRRRKSFKSSSPTSDGDNASDV